MLGGITKRSSRSILLIIFIISALVAGAAYVMENYLGVMGCQMCHYERNIFIGAGILALFGFLVLSNNFRSVMVAILGALFLSGFFFASYHIAIQQHLVAMPVFCNGVEPDVITAIIQPIPSAPMPGCDQVTASFMGFSLAYYNAGLSLLLALFCWIWAFNTPNGKSKGRSKR